MTFSAKKTQTHENLSSALQKTFHFIRKKHFSCFWAFTLKIAFSNIFSLRKKFLSIRGLATSSFALNTELVFLEAIKKWFCAIKLIICTKHRIGVLRSYKEVILCNLALKWLFLLKNLKLMKICLLHCKKHFISLERNIFHVFEPLLLKLHLATFSHWGRSFWASVASQPHHLLSCTKHRIGVLRSYKEVILCS